MVFNIAEGLRGLAVKPRYLHCWRHIDIPYTFSDPLVMSLSLHKGHTKRVIRDAGVPTPDFLVVEAGRQIGPVSFAPPYFVKPVAEGTGKGITPASIIRHPEDLGPRCVELIGRLSAAGACGSVFAGTRIHCRAARHRIGSGGDRHDRSTSARRCRIADIFLSE